MNNYKLQNKLVQLKIEDYIWVIYIGIILLSWYSNSLERKYFIYILIQILQIVMKKTMFKTIRLIFLKI